MTQPAADQRIPPVWWTVILILVMFILATTYPATKRLTDSVHPVTVSLFRYALGTAAMVPLCLVELRRRPRIIPSDLLGLSLLGAVGIALFSVCLTLGVRYSTASNGSLLANSQPIFTTLLAPLINRENFTPLRLLGALAGTLLLLPAAFAFTGGRPLSGLNGSHLVMLAHIGVVGAALVYPVFHRALGASGVVRAVGFKLLIPVFGIALSMLLLGERPGWRTAVGAAVVIGAIALIQTDRAREPGVPAARRTSGSTAQ